MSAKPMTEQTKAVVKSWLLKCKDFRIEQLMQAAGLFWTVSWECEQYMYIVFPQTVWSTLGLLTVMGWQIEVVDRIRRYLRAVLC